tara:strand:+ start:35916 stop:37028 length:1113 start_codon:yes stop_codon:yes gene_type:complete
MSHGGNMMKVMFFEWTKKQDTTRVITLASGWDDVKDLGDIRDLHDYTTRPAIPTLNSEKRTIVIGEGGGFASAVPKHNWLGRSNEKGEIKNPLFGGFNPEIPRDTVLSHDLFRPTFTEGEPFGKQYNRFINHLLLLKNSGLRAIVYTQLTDMKLEENGWLTFDRKVSKIDEGSLFKMHTMLINKEYSQNIILSNSTNRKHKWMVGYLPFPKKNPNVLDAVLLQESPDLSEIKWNENYAPFGNLINKRTLWDGKNQLFAKKTFKLDKIPSGLSVRVFSCLEGDTPWLHSRIYINGVFVADETTRQKMPEQRMAEVIIPKNKMHLLQKGENTITIQFVPGLRSQTGRLANFPEKISVDIEMTTFDKNYIPNN